MKAKIIGIGIAVSVIISIIIAIAFVGPIDVSPPKIENEFEGWNRSGPFAIDKLDYKIGDNIFIVVDGLTTDDVGAAIFVLPNGTTKYISIPFNGTEKSGFNQYFKPSISKSRNICSVSDIIGEWTIIFQGTDYKPLKFTMLNETLTSETGNFQRVC